MNGPALPPVPGTPEGQWASAEAWRAWFLELNEDQQLLVAGARVDDHAAAHRCFIGNHQGLLERVQYLERALARHEGRS